MATELQHEVGLAGRYATAVYELASETNSVDALENDLLALRAMMNESADLTRLVRAPVFSQEVQAKALRALLARMGAAKITTQFVLLLTSKRRLFILADVIRAFERIVARARGEIQAQVVSARALSTGETADLKAALKSRLGREPRLETKVDPSLLGGLVVKVGSRMIDSSLRTKLLGLRAAMRGN
ncbi:MAG TPA: F0F1 ATP synthase subunit delta [Rhizomicrobium sp.]|nr:F0F1 ATP synthase subunit delta [Rhizomicrobium sp.]